MASQSYLDVTRSVLAESMASDPSILLLGKDLESGGVFGTARGLAERFGSERVRQLAGMEHGLIGFALGASLAGARPVIDLSFSEWMLAGIAELAQFAAVWPALAGGRMRLPLVLRVATGPAAGVGPFLSGNHHPALVHLPGLSVVAPSSPRSGAALLRAALGHDRPVILLEHKALLETQGEPPEPDAVLPLDRAEVMRPGQNLTLVTYGPLVTLALDAAKAAARAGAAVEVIDLRTLAPLDVGLVARSVAKTGRLLIIDDAYGSCSIASEVAAQIAAHAFDYLDAPIHRLTAPRVPAPYGPAQQDSFAPQLADVVRAITEQIQE